MHAICLFCGGNRSEPGHLERCDGRQGAIEAAPIGPHFDGETYEPAPDYARLSHQLALVWGVMLDGTWRTLEQLADATGAPAASVSARLRDLRKPKFGEHAVERRCRGERAHGLYEYRLVPNGRVDVEAAGVAV